MGREVLVAILFLFLFLSVPSISAQQFGYNNRGDEFGLLNGNNIWTGINTFIGNVTMIHATILAVNNSITINDQLGNPTIVLNGTGVSTFDNDIEIGGVGVSQWLYNQTEAGGGNFNYNQSLAVPGNVSIISVDNITDFNFNYNQTQASGDFNYNQTSNWTTNGTAIFSVDGITQVGIGTQDTLHTFEVVGHVGIDRVASGTDQHALDIEANANGFGGFKAILIDYISGALAPGNDDEAILININDFDSLGGEITGIEILTTEGAANVIGMEVGVLVSPIEQLSGIFSNMDSALNNSIDVLTAFITPGDDIYIFADNGDTVTIGNDVKFEEIEFILSVVASGAGIKPIFYFSTGVGSWNEFSPADGTNGLRATGVIAWLDSDIPSWALGTGSEYLIRINRTQASISNIPIENKVQIASATEYFWNKDGFISILNLSASDEIYINNVAVSHWLYNQTEAGGSNFNYNQTTIILNTVNTTGNIQGLLNSTDIYSTFNSSYSDFSHNQTSNWTTNGTAIFTVDGITQVGIGTTDLMDTFNVLGSFDLVHVSTGTDDHALEIDFNAAGFGDNKAIDINYVTGAISLGDDEEVILINIDESLAIGGDVVGIEIIGTEGSANLIGMQVGALVSPIEQLSGIFSNMDSALNNSIDVLTAFITPGDDIDIFVNDDDTVTIGNDIKFEEIEFLLDTSASNPGISPIFYFSTGVGTWGEFTPADGTNGLRNNGVMVWLDSDIPSWALGTGSEFLIRINRTRNSLSTIPIESKVQIASTTEYFWDKNAYLSIFNASFANEIYINDVSVSEWLYNQTEAAGSNFNYNQTTIILNTVNTTGNIQGLLNLTNIYSTFNSTYDQFAYNQTEASIFNYNQTEASIFNYNQTEAEHSIFNVTYSNFAYNQTSIANTFTSDVNLSLFNTFIDFNYNQTEASIFNYNQTTIILNTVNTTGNIQGLLNLTNIYSTFNSTYDQFAYNQTEAGDTTFNYNQTNLGGWNVSGNNIFQRDLSDLVGIGNPAPIKNLHVGTSTMASNQEIMVENAVGNFAQVILGSGGANWTIGHQSTFVGGGLLFRLNDTSANDFMLLNRRGDLGIGTTSPNNKLSVVSNNFVIANFSSSSTTGSAFELNNDGNIVRFQRVGSGIAGREMNFEIATDAAVLMAFDTSTNFVGIGGTIKPEATLNVFGNIQVNSTSGDEAIIIPSEKHLAVNVPGVGARNLIRYTAADDAIVIGEGTSVIDSVRIALGTADTFLVSSALVAFQNRLTLTYDDPVIVLEDSVGEDFYMQVADDMLFFGQGTSPSGANDRLGINTDGGLNVTGYITTAKTAGNQTLNITGGARITVGTMPDNSYAPFITPLDSEDNVGSGFSEATCSVHPSNSITTTTFDILCVKSDPIITFAFPWAGGNVTWFVVDY